jgi:hypothetical protein
MSFSSHSKKKSSSVMHAFMVFRLTLSTSQGFVPIPIISLKSMRKLYERSGIHEINTLFNIYKHHLLFCYNSVLKFSEYNISGNIDF